jgi:hypothetical protein
LTLSTLGRNLEGLAKNVRDSHRLRDAGQALDTRRADLNRTLKEWQPLFDISRRFKQEQIGSSLTINRAGFCRRALEEYQRDLGDSVGAEDPGSLKLFKEYRHPFQNDLRDHLAERWESHVEAKRNAEYGEKMVESYDAVHATLVQRVRAADAELARISQKLPGTPMFREGRTGPFETAWLDEDLESLRKALDELRSALGELPEEAPPPEVQEFLRAARLGGASTDLYTDFVREWIDGAKMSGRFFVVMRDEPSK